MRLIKISTKNFFNSNKNRNIPINYLNTNTNINTSKKSTIQELQKFSNFFYYFKITNKNNNNNKDNNIKDINNNLLIKNNFFPISKFSFTKKTSEYEEQIKKELEKSDKERSREKRVEEWKKIKDASYTKEEFEKHIEGKDEILLIEISDANKKKLFFAKYFCVFFNIPVSLFITFFIDSILPTYIPGNRKHAAMYYGLMITDYILFVNGVLILNAISNVCLNAKYLPKENIIQFVRFNLLNKSYIVKEKVEDVKRIGSGPFSPFNSLKSKATNNTYALKGINIWNDIKLFNYLFPIPQKKTPKADERNKNRKDKNDKFEKAKEEMLKK